MVSIRFLKECEATEATHRFDAVNTVDDIFPSGSENGLLHDIREKQKIIDISGLAGNDDYIFEFSNNGQTWIDGYLAFVNKQEGLYYISHGVTGGIEQRIPYKMCKFKSRWYPWFGGGECPLPEGIVVKVKRYTEYRFIGGGFEVATSLDWEDTINYITAYLIVGPYDDWKYPWQVDECN